MSKGADWDCMLMNYYKYKRPMSYKVLANSFNDAVVFMTKVAQKEDHRRLIRVTALKLDVDEFQSPKIEMERFNLLFNQLAIRKLSIDTPHLA